MATRTHTSKSGRSGMYSRNPKKIRPRYLLARKTAVEILNFCRQYNSTSSWNVLMYSYVTRAEVLG